MAKTDALRIQELRNKSAEDDPQQVAAYYTKRLQLRDTPFVIALYVWASCAVPQPSLSRLIE